MPTSPAAPTACRASTLRRSSACSVSICTGTPPTSTASSCCSSFRRGAPHRAFAVRPFARRAARQSAARPRVGIPVNARLVAIYTVSAGFAGIAGALLTQTTAFGSLDVLSFDRSADALLVLIIGGTGYLYGGFIGAVIYRFLQDYLRI